MDALMKHIAKNGFRLRGTAMSRVDGFSDVVFGFALTLLVVSLEVPKTYDELHTMMRGFIPFAISFTLLLMIWYAHFEFFRRFGLHDFRTIVINAALLFVVLFYVYPLKFLFTVIVSGMMGDQHAGEGITRIEQIPELMIVYGVGFALIYFLFAALYWNAWSQRAELGLNELERMQTKHWIAESAGVGSIGLLSCLAARLLPPNQAGLAGFVYMLIGLFRWGHGRYTGGRQRVLHERLASEAAQDDTSSNQAC